MALIKTEAQFYDIIMGAGLGKRVFTVAEIEKTGCSINQIDAQAFHKLCLLRRKIDSPINFFHNGINSGEHKSRGHKEGKAFDFWTPCDPKKVVYSAIEVGLLRFGVYKNENEAFGYHLEDSDIVGTWQGIRFVEGDPWEMGSLFKLF
jgi:hypothetical protein